MKATLTMKDQGTGEEGTMLVDLPTNPTHEDVMAAAGPDWVPESAVMIGWVMINGRGALTMVEPESHFGDSLIIIGISPNE